MLKTKNHNSSTHHIYTLFFNSFNTVQHENKITQHLSSCQFIHTPLNPFYSKSLKIQTVPDYSRFRLFQITQDSDSSRSLKIQSVLDHSWFHSRSFMIKSISFMIQSFPVHSKHDLVSLSSQIQSISYSCLALTMCSKNSQFSYTWIYILVKLMRGSNNSPTLTLSIWTKMDGEKLMRRSFWKGLAWFDYIHNSNILNQIYIYILYYN